MSSPESSCESLPSFANGYIAYEKSPLNYDYSDNYDDNASGEDNQPQMYDTTAVYNCDPGYMLLGNE